METLLTFIPQWAWALLGVSGFGMALDMLLKKYLSESRLNAIENWLPELVDDAGTSFGNWLNDTGLTIPAIGKMWNRTFEPWVIVLLRVIGLSIGRAIVIFVEHCIAALQSDNPSTKE